MSKKIFASNNKTKYTLVDDDVFETIQKMNLKFSINKRGYFISTSRIIKLPEMAKKKHLLLHRFVWIIKAGEEPSSEIDHIDINKSNNQFENLRLATRQQQNQHQGKRNDNKSGYIGVSHNHNVDNRRKKNNIHDYWQARIRKPDGHTEAKRFPYTEAGKIAAAKYYDTKAQEYYKEFAVTNFPDENQ